MNENGQVSELKKVVRELAFNEAQYSLFLNAEPESNRVEFWQIVAGALAYGQGFISAREGRYLGECLDTSHPALTPIALIARKLALATERKSYELKSGAMIWEPVEQWVDRIVFDLHANGSLVGWTKFEIEELVHALYGLGDVARFDIERSMNDA